MSTDIDVEQDITEDDDKDSEHQTLLKLPIVSGDKITTVHNITEKKDGNRGLQRLQHLPGVAGNRKSTDQGIPEELDEDGEYLRLQEPSEASGGKSDPSTDHGLPTANISNSQSPDHEGPFKLPSPTWSLGLISNGTLTPDQELFMAVCENKIEAVESLLKAGVNPNVRQHFYSFKHLEDDYRQEFLRLSDLVGYDLAHTCLHVSSAYAWKQCTKLLLEAEADPNICDEIGRSVLDVVGLGLYHYKEMTWANQKVQLPVDIMSDFPEVISLIQEHGGKIRTSRLPGSYKPTPLHAAVKLKNTGAFRQLIRTGAFAGCFNREGLTPLHMCVAMKFVQPFKILAEERKDSIPELDLNEHHELGHTVLHAAVLDGWIEGVRALLKLGADITKTARNGEAPIHAAAALGHLDILQRILIVAKRKNLIKHKNERGESALFKAVTNGNLDCIKAILEELATSDVELTEGGANVFHVIAKNGHKDVLVYFLRYYVREALRMRLGNLKECLSETDGFAPIHYAVAENHQQCVEKLIVFAYDISAFIRIRTGLSNTYTNVVEGSTPLHIAAAYNHVEIAKYLLDKDITQDKTIMQERNAINELPLHTAIKHSSRDVIRFFLNEGANLASSCTGPEEYEITTIDLVMNYISYPTQYLKDVFDSYISINKKNLLDPNCEVEIDYRILMPDKETKVQMKVIEALLKTGNQHDQESLLLHPLIESFLHLKWTALTPFFYWIISFYAVFLMSLTIFSYSVFYYKDIEEDKPTWISLTACSVTMYLSIFIILFQEILLNLQLLFGIYDLLSNKTWLQGCYFVYNHTDVETCTKVISIGLAMILPPAVFLVDSEAQWPRQVATGALLLAWIQMMILLSRFPRWGYYVLMFGRVAWNVAKILLTFLLLLVGFSLSFMIQFRAQEPFEGLISALIKTMVMMTSEFDYSDLFYNNSTPTNSTDTEHRELPSYGPRLVFVIFVVLAAIVLMNLMTGVAVNDINNLELLGNIQRLKKQVAFLSVLETFSYNSPLPKILPKKFNEKIKERGSISSTIKLKLGKPGNLDDKSLPAEICDSIFKRAQELFVKNEPKKTEMAEVLNKIEKLDEEVASIKEQITSLAQTVRSAMEVVEQNWSYNFKKENKNKLN